MALSDITDSTTPQYRLRENYIRKGHLYYDLDGLADIYGKKIVAVTSSKGYIGDKVLIIFQSQLHNWRNDNSLEAIIGDEKDQSDKNLPYDAYRHFMGFIKDV